MCTNENFSKLSNLPKILFACTIPLDDMMVSFDTLASFTRLVFLLLIFVLCFSSSNCEIRWALFCIFLCVDGADGGFMGLISLVEVVEGVES